MTEIPSNNATRNALIALQKTSRLIEETTQRLATGLKVISALDDPQNFFAARALNFRAEDLSGRLDGITQSIRALQETDQGIIGSIKLIDLIESYLQDVLDRMRAGEIDLGVGDPANITLIRPSAPDFLTYSPGQDSGGPVSVTNGGADIAFNGNLWKRLLVNYTVTPDTILDFEFASSATPEITAIGFDDDNNYINSSDYVFLNGTQTTGITYAAPTPTFQYLGVGSYQSYSIPVGTFFTGTFTNLVFINDDDAAPLGNAFFRNVQLREGPLTFEPLAPPEIEEGYVELLGQLDELVEDAHYRGIHLLKEERLTTLFNEDGTSSLTTNGINATANGLGLSQGSFNSIEAIEDRINRVQKARETLRGYGRTIATNLSVIQTRLTFTQETINALRAGAQNLTVADQNEEGANLLALQTRQALAQTSLSLLVRGNANIINLFS